MWKNENWLRIEKIEEIGKISLENRFTLEEGKGGLSCLICLSQLSRQFFAFFLYIFKANILQYFQLNISYIFSTEKFSIFLVRCSLQLQNVHFIQRFSRCSQKTLFLLKSNRQIKSTSKVDLILLERYWKARSNNTQKESTESSKSLK